MVCWFGLVGCENSTVIEQRQTVKLVNDTIIKMINTTKTDVTQHQLNTQDMDITFDYVGANCDLNVTQSITATQKTNINLNTSTQAKLNEQITAALQAANKNAIDQQSNAFQTANNDGTVTNSSDLDIKSAVEINMGTDTAATLTQLMENPQKMKVHVGRMECVKGQPPKNFLQNIVAQQYADLIVTALTGTTIDKVMGGDSNVDNDTDVKQVGKGLSGIIDSIFGGIAGIFTSVGDIFSKSILYGILAVVLPCVVCVGLIYMLVHHHSTSAATAAAVKSIPVKFGKITNSFGKITNSFGKITNSFGKYISHFGKRRRFKQRW